MVFIWLCRRLAASPLGPTLALWVLASALLVLGTSTKAAEDNLISFRIKDQFDRLHTDGRYRKSVVVVYWGDRKGSEYVDNWEPVLGDSLTAETKSFRVREISVAHVKGVPFFIKGKIKVYFSKDPDEWVLMDWGGEFDKAYDCTQDHCNVLVFGRDGRLRGHWALTESDPTALAKILALMRELLRS
jgi:hypothetical protein